MAPLPLWPEALAISLGVMPAALLLLFLALPAWRSRLAPLAGLALVGLAVAFSEAGVPVLSNFCKLGALAAFGWWFLGFFEAISWVVVVAVLIPFVDAFSVFAGPTKTLTNGRHEHVFTTLSIVFVGPAGGAERLGLPDILFFSVFLAASARFALRPAATWCCMVLGLVATVVIAIAGVNSNGGLPALPGISLGFLVPNADLLWRRLRRDAPLE